MKRIFFNRAMGMVALGVLNTPLVNASAAENSFSDQRIRKIVASLLSEKDKKIEQLEARIKQLEINKPTVPILALPSTDNTSISEKKL